MSIDISIRGNVVSLVSKGTSSAEDIARQLVELYQSPDFPREPIMFWDMRNSDSLGERNSTDMELIAGKTSHLIKDIRLRSVFLVPNDLYYGMVRMATAHGGADDDDFHIFKSEAEAMAMLDRLEGKHD